MTNIVAPPVQAAADWGSINEQGRLAIPADVTNCVSWYNSKKSIPVSIELSRPKIIVVRDLTKVAEILGERRQILITESENPEIGARRVAMTYHFFREANLTNPDRRIILKSVVLDHLETRPGGRLFCLGYLDRIEVYNETAARDLIAYHASDLVIGPEPE